MRNFFVYKEIEIINTGLKYGLIRQIDNKHASVVLIFGVDVKMHLYIIVYLSVLKQSFSRFEAKLIEKNP